MSKLVNSAVAAVSAAGLIAGGIAASNGGEAGPEVVSAGASAQPERKSGDISWPRDETNKQIGNAAVKNAVESTVAPSPIVVETPKTDPNTLADKKATQTPAPTPAPTQLPVAPAKAPETMVLESKPKTWEQLQEEARLKFQYLTSMSEGQSVEWACVSGDTRLITNDKPDEPIDKGPLTVLEVTSGQIGDFTRSYRLMSLADGQLLDPSQFRLSDNRPWDLAVLNNCKIENVPNQGIKITPLVSPTVSQ